MKKFLNYGLGAIAIGLVGLGNINSVQAMSSPTISSLSPEFAYSNTDPDFTMRILGSGFVSGAQVVIAYPSADLTAPTVRSVNFVSSSELLAVVQVSFSDQAGFYTITVINPDGGTVAKTGWELRKKASTSAFYPSITKVEPSQVDNKTATSLVIYGEQFEGTNPLVRLLPKSGPLYYDLSTQRLNHMEIHAVVPAGLPVGIYDLLVRGGGGYGGNQTISLAALEIKSLVVEPVLPPVNEPSPSLDDAVTVPLPPTTVPANLPAPSKFDYRAVFVDQNGTVGPNKQGILTHIIQVHPGEDIDMWLTMKNVGKSVWLANPSNPDQVNQVRLGLTKDATSLFTHLSWLSINRLTAVSQDIASGSTATINFKLHISKNQSPGKYQLSVGLVAEWVKWIFDDIHWEIQVI